MVYITAADGVEKKYACIKCIKGHRSSKCTHRDRELFEIKRKGRPVSQCENCRFLRKTKQVHIKCMCHVNKEQDTNKPIIDQGFRYTTLDEATPSSCKQCERPSIYCICQNEIDIKQEVITMDSEDGSTIIHHPFESSSTSQNNITSAGLNINTNDNDNDVVPLTTATSNLTTSVPASPSSNASQLTTKPFNRHLPIPIHDPSDDIDSDTPIYKSVEDNEPPLGEFTSKSSDELINQIYSGFDPANSSTSSPLLREDDDQLIEISKDL